MQYLRADTQVIVTIGPFVDATDGLTPETGVTLSGADEAEIIKHGSTSVVDISGATWAAVTGCDGYYSLTLTTSHTDTEGMLIVVVQDDSVCLPVKAEYMVLAAQVYDSMILGTDYLQTDAVQIEGTDATNQINAECDTALADYDAPTATEMTAAFTEIKGATWSSSTDTLEAISMFIDQEVAAILVDTSTVIPGQIANLPTAAEIRAEMDTNSTQLAAIVADTNELQVDWTNGGRLDLIVDELTTNVDAVETDTQDIQSRIPAALVSGRMSSDAVAISGSTTAADNVEANIGNLDAAVSDVLTDTAEIGVAGAGLTEAGGTGDQLTAVPWNVSWDAEVQSECTDALNAYDPPTAAELTSGLSGLNDPTAAAIADAVWDEALAGHAGVGSSGEALSAAGTAGDPWTTALPGAYGAGSAGYIIGNNVNAPISTVDTVVDAIKAVTDNLPDSGALSTITGYVDCLPATLNDLDAAGIRAAVGLASANLDTQLGTIDGNVDAILVDTGTDIPATLSTIAGYIDTEVAAILVDTGTTIPAQIAALSIPTAADIRTEIDANSTQLAAIVEDTNDLQTNQGDWATAVGFSTHSAADVWSVATRVLTAGTNLNDISVSDVLTTQMTESYATDGTAPTLAQALMLIQQSLTEVSISGTTITIKKLDGSTTAATLTIDDDTTPTSKTRAT